MIPFMQVLQGFVLFEDFSLAELQKTLELLGASVRSFARHSIIRHEGLPVTEAGIVVKGMALVTKLDFSGNRNILKSIPTGDSFGESLALAKTKDSPVAIMAASACTICFLPIKSLLNPDPRLGSLCDRLSQNLIKLLALKHLALHKKADILSQKSIRQKLMLYLEYLYADSGSTTVRVGFNMEELADYLCVNRSALSREMSKMQGDGLFKRNKNRFTLLLKPPKED